ncbi:MAG: DUF1501 domain-containing protein [Pseudomonadota bacterium]
MATSYGLGLAGLGDLAAQSSHSDYKALVCVFLYGGNDHANTLIPFDPANYAEYERLRGGREGVALPRDQLAAQVLSVPEGQTLTDSIQYALAPAMPRLKSLYDQGQMAALLNVGPLLAPLTRAQYESSNTSAFPRPPKLFSHNDQQASWQAFAPEGADQGWGGRLADIGMSANSNSMFTAMNVTGNAVFLNGSNASSFKLSARGPIKMYGIERQLYGQNTASSALREIIGVSNGNVLASDYAQVTSRSIMYSDFILDALKNAPSSTKFGSGSSLQAQLSMVAQLVSARHNLGVTRQVFLVSMGGFDNHANLTSKHQGLLGELDTALHKFQSAISGLGLQDQVTTFTASDFGRTLVSNGRGTDHGWGGHHFIVGGGVNGSAFYGTAPHVSDRTDDQVGRGRLLPTTSVDEYAATLAVWFGVSPSDVGYVAPNIGRFGNSDLGFMRREDDDR